VDAPEVVAMSPTGHDAVIFDHAKFIECGPREPIEVEYADDLEDQVGSLKGENIVFILKQTDSDNSGYVVFSFSDETEGSYGKLSCLLAHSLPEQMLQRHLLTTVPDHLRCDATHPVTVVVSTHSGLCRAEEFHRSILQPLLAAVDLAPRTAGREEGGDEHSYEVIITQNDRTIKELGKRLQEESSGPDSSTAKPTVILLSGDGGVVDLLNGSDDPSVPSSPAGTKPSIILLPMGTGNALFHSLHKSLYASHPSTSHFVIALRTLFRGKPAPLPVFQAEFSPGARLMQGAEATGPVDHLLGAIVASYGFHAQLVWESDTPAYRKHGDKRFGMAAEELLKVGHGYDADVLVRTGEGEEEWKTPQFTAPGKKVAYALTTLVSNLEKTFTISPEARPLDGKLRLVGFGDVGGEKTLEVMKAAYNEGQHVGLKWKEREGEESVGYEEVKEVKVVINEEDERWRKVCVDGTTVDIPKGGWLRVARVEPRFDIVVDGSLV
jgi:diacylglycerol kinase family enzyme